MINYLGQREFLEAQADIVAFSSERGSGKTHALLHYSIQASKHHEQGMGLLLTKQVDHLLFVASTLEVERPHINLSKRTVTWQQSHHVLHVSNARDWERFRGMRPDWIGIDNLEDFTPDDLVQASYRLAPDGCMRVTYNVGTSKWPTAFFWPWTAAARGSEVEVAFGAIRHFSDPSHDGTAIRWSTEPIPHQTRSATVIR